LCALLLSLALCACGGTTVKADISAYGDTEIVISGLLEEDFTVTPYELAAMECTSLTVTGTTQKAGTVSVVGPTLETFLAAYGKSVSEFKRIRFYGSDDYYKGFLPEALEKYEFVLGVANGKNPLGETEQPVHLVVSGGESNSWVRMVVRIEFEYTT